MPFWAKSFARRLNWLLTLVRMTDHTSHMRSLNLLSVRTICLAGIILGGLVGFSFRLLAAFPKIASGRETWLMTLAFLALGPFAVGWVTATTAERSGKHSWLIRIFLPWPAILLASGIAFLLNMEGLICVVFALPIALFFASLGGVVSSLTTQEQRISKGPLTCVILLPVLAAPVEARLTPPAQTRTVETQIRIHAKPDVVWSNIKKVRPIAPAELPRTWTHAIGFPRPVAATLSYEGISGVR